MFITEFISNLYPSPIFALFFAAAQLLEIIHCILLILYRFEVVPYQQPTGSLYYSNNDEELFSSGGSAHVVHLRAR